MTRTKTSSLAGAVLALLFAALLALCLAGCGDQSSSSSTAASSDSTSASSEAAGSDADAAAAEIGLEALEADDGSQAKDLADLPTRADEELADLGSDEIEVGIDDASKAPSGLTLLRVGGIQVYLPQNWKSSQTDKLSCEITSSDRSIQGFMSAKQIQGSAVTSMGTPIYDVEAVASAVPGLLEKYGATNVEVISYEKAYSKSGLLVASRITIAANIDGATYVYYWAFFACKSYNNQIMLTGELDNFRANLSDISIVADSAAYAPGEEI